MAPPVIATPPPFPPVELFWIVLPMMLALAPSETAIPPPSPPNDNWFPVITLLSICPPRPPLTGNPSIQMPPPLVKQFEAMLLLIVLWRMTGALDWARIPVPKQPLFSVMMLFSMVGEAPDIITAP